MKEIILDLKTLITLILLLVSGAFTVGIYASSTSLISKRVSKLEESSKTTSKLLCLMALEVVKEKEKIVKKICLRGDKL